MWEQADRAIIFWVFFIAHFVLQNGFRLLRTAGDVFWNMYWLNLTAKASQSSYPPALTGSMLMPSSPGAFSFLIWKVAFRTSLISTGELGPWRRRVYICSSLNFINHYTHVVTKWMNDGIFLLVLTIVDFRSTDTAPTNSPVEMLYYTTFGRAT